MGWLFGTIGDVTEKLLRERNKPIEQKELENILCRELYISQDSIINVLVRYENEQRFTLLKNNMISKGMDLKLLLWQQIQFRT